VTICLSLRGRRIRLTRLCELDDFDRWFKGPSFLLEDTFVAKSFDVEAKLKDADVLVESRDKDTVTCAVTTNDEIVARSNVANVINCTRFGNFNKLLNTLLYVL